MNSKEGQELEEVFKLIELENIHLSESRTRVTFVGKFLSATAGNSEIYSYNFLSPKN